MPGTIIDWQNGALGNCTAVVAAHDVCNQQQRRRQASQQ